MVSIGFIGFIVILLILLQAMESFALNFEDKEQADILAKKRALFAHGDHGLKGRKMMKTDNAKELNDLKGSENYKKAHYRIEKRKLRGVLNSSKWSSLKDSHPSKSNMMNEYESLSADYGHPNPHPPGHN